MSLIIGIDLGSTNSLVSYRDGEKAVIIPNAFGDNLKSSVVGLDDHNQILVGAAAKTPHYCNLYSKSPLWLLPSLFNVKAASY